MSGVILSGVGSPDVTMIRTVLGDQEAVDESDLTSPKVLGELTHLQPLVVVLGPEMPGVDCYEIAGRIVNVDPTVGILIIDSLDEANVIRALEAGARGVLAPGSSASETRKAFDRVIEGTRRLRGHHAVAEPEVDHRVIVVVSAKGGAGKTMVSVNLATALALAERRGTAIVDLDLQFGDVAAALLLEPDQTIADAADSIAADGSKTTALKVFLTRHEPSGLFALCGSEDPASGEEIKPGAVTAIIEELSQEFRRVVVDTPAGLGESTLAVLEQATDIVMVVDLDVASVRGGKKLIEALDVIGMREQRRHVVLNRSNSKVGLRVDEVEIVLKAQIDILLPSTRAVPMSFNQGEPLVIARPRLLYSRRITELASRFVGAGSRRRSR